MNKYKELIKSFTPEVDIETVLTLAWYKANRLENMSEVRVGPAEMVAANKIAKMMTEEEKQNLYDFIEEE